MAHDANLGIPIKVIADKYKVAQSEVSCFLRNNSILDNEMVEAYFRTGLSIPSICKLYGITRKYMLITAIRSFLFKHHCVEYAFANGSPVRKSAYVLFINTYTGSIEDLKDNVVSDIKNGMDKVSMIMKYKVSEEIMDGIIELCKSSDMLPKNFSMLTVKDIVHAYNYNDAMNLMSIGMHVDDIYKLTGISSTILNKAIAKSRWSKLSKYDAIKRLNPVTTNAIVKLSDTMSKEDIALSLSVNLEDMDTVS